MTLTLDTDALIIGAGIAGTSVAYFLSPHASVRILEREPYAGMHSTGRSAALFAVTYGPPQVRTLTRASRAFFEHPPQGFADNPILTPRGVLTVGPAEHAAELEALYAAIRADLPSARLLRDRDIRALVPVLNPSFANTALFEPDASDMDVNALHQGFIRGLKARGGDLLCGVDIRSIERSQDRWCIDTGERRFRAPLLINAAGAWVDQVAAQAGVAPIGIEPRRRSAFLFAPPEGVDTAHWPFVVSADETFYFKPDAGLLLGSPANADPVSAHDVQPDDLDIAIAVDRIEAATSLRIDRPIRAWAGLRSFVADGDLVGGFARDAPGFFWVAALGGYGIQTCPAMGEACAHLALGRALPTCLSDAGINAAMLAPRT
jgi:D-arginine dehydrogenase